MTPRNDVSAVLHVFKRVGACLTPELTHMLVLKSKQPLFLTHKHLRTCSHTRTHAHTQAHTHTHIHTLKHTHTTYIHVPTCVGLLPDPLEVSRSSLPFPFVPCCSAPSASPPPDTRRPIVSNNNARALEPACVCVYVYVCTCLCKYVCVYGCVCVCL
jgi:hypothetical protein